MTAYGGQSAIRPYVFPLFETQRVAANVLPHRWLGVSFRVKNGVGCHHGWRLVRNYQSDSVDP